LYSGEILTQLRQAIVGGQMKKGVRLVEHRLASEFGVSRGPVRSALQVLEGEGLVRTLPTGGMVVSGFGHHDLASLFKVRGLLESSAVRWGTALRAVGRPVGRALVVAFGQSRFLLQAWDSLAPVLEAAITVGHQAATGRFAARSREHILEAHIPIAEAISAYDADRAIFLLEQQFTEAEQVLWPLYARDGGNEPVDSSTA
jgi:DNA-binding GntR family transcriptional regulator